jgi:hypothetical protein
VFPVPAALLHAACRAAGWGDLYDRVAGPLVADAAALRGLGWVPGVASGPGLAALMRMEVNGLAQQVAPKFT